MEIPRTTYEQRAPLYDGIEDLIYPGYLTAPCRIGSTTIVLRSLGPADYLALQYLEQDRMDWILSRAVLRVDGRPLGGEPEVFDQLVTLPPAVRKRLYSAFLQVQAKVEQAAKRIASFCYESVSRWRWQTSGRRLLDPMTAVGSHVQLGLNVVQQTWLAFNMMEDQRHADLRYWQGCKLIASTQSPKGVAQLNKLDEQAAKDEEDRRQFVQDQMYYEAFGIVLTQQDFTINGLRFDSVTGMYHARTIEDMEEQLRREIAGEEDWHDRAVRQWREGLLAQQQAERDARSKRAEKVLGRESPLVEALFRTETEMPMDYGFLKQPETPLTVQGGRIVAKEGYKIVGDPTILNPPVEPLALENHRVMVQDSGLIGRG